MVRSRQQLEASRDALRYAVRGLQREIELIEADIASLGAELRLDDKFFWTILAPMLVGTREGLTTAYMLRMLRTGGIEVAPGNLRTFISRYGKRELLESSGTGRALLWKLTAKSRAELPTRRRGG
jgi:hypothetical protein